MEISRRSLKSMTITLQDLADDLESCQITLRVAERFGQINNEDRLVKILGRVPSFIKSRWQKRVQEIRNEGKDANIGDWWNRGSGSK